MPVRRVAREPYHRGVNRPYRRRDRLDHRLDTGRLRGRHVRAVARALAVFQDGVETRLARRDSRDGGPDGEWPAIARSVTGQWQAPSPGEPGRHVRIDTGRPGREWLRALGLGTQARA